MEKATKKSIDPIADDLFKKAAKANLELTWDLHEDNLPHCGFGELALCCSKCMQGPCRIDPFRNNAKYGSCGRDAKTIASENLVQQLLSGLAQVIEEIDEIEILKENKNIQSYLNGGFNLEAEAIIDRSFKLIEDTFTELDLDIEKNEILNDVNLNNKKIVLLGKISDEKLNLLKKSKNVSLFSMLNEFGYEGVKPLTNYGGQEFILMSKFPDLIVAGPGCGKPILKKLAEEYNIPFIYENELSKEYLADIESSENEKFDYLDFNFVNEYEDKVLKAKKIALVAGCNNLKYTQDKKLKKITEKLLKSGYTILTSGCAAMGLNKYFSNDEEIYYFGSCYSTPTFKKIADKYKNKEVVAVFPELSQMKAFTQASYLALNGIRTYVMSKAFMPPYEEFKNILDKLNPNFKIKSEGYTIEQFLDTLEV